MSTNKLTEEEKIRIIGLIENSNLTQKEIASQFSCAASTVGRLKRKFDETKSVANKKNKGKRSTFNDQDLIDVKNIFLDNYCITVNDVQKQYEIYYQRKIGKSTLRRMMIKAGLNFGYKSKQFSTPKAAVKRSKFAKESLKRSSKKKKTKNIET